MHCFVPGCNTGCAKTKKKFPVFRPPADPDLFRQWERNIGRTDRALNRRVGVCALHFEKHLIYDRYYSEHAGNVLLNERKVARLRKGAVPTIFEGQEVGASGVPESSPETVAQQPPDAGVPPRGSSPSLDASNYSAEMDASLETMPCPNTDVDGQNGELDQRITVKSEEEDSSNASMTMNMELRIDDKVAAPSVHPDFRVKVENEEYCLGVQSPEEVVCNEDQDHVVKQLGEVESNDVGVGCGVEVKREECPDQQCPLQVPTIVCIGKHFYPPQAPRIVPRTLVEHLVYHPEVVKLPLTWNYHKVRAPRGNRVVYCTLAVASDGMTPVISKFVNITDSSRGEPLEAFVSNRSVNGVLGDAAKPMTVEEVEHMIEAIDRLPMCCGGPPRDKYPDVDPVRARVDALGVWRHADCEVYGTSLCCHCARLSSTLRVHASRQRKRKASAKLRISLESLPPGQRSKVELLRKRSRCLYKKLRRLTGGGKELWGDDGSGDSENGIEYPEALS